MSSQRVRYSIAQLEQLYTSGENRSLLENVIRAFRGIMDKDPSDADSFFNIAGFHGEPFRGKGETDSAWWGGYCNHGNVLFPTWHRAYILRFEDALRSVPGCEEVTLPFWDELLTMRDGSGTPIPSVLTASTFPLDGRDDNPLYSYKLQQTLTEKVVGTANRYTKPVGYQTVRYPLSGLVGTKEDVASTDLHNSSYKDPVHNVTLLNSNVANWLEGTVKITPDPNDPGNAGRVPDTYSVAARYLLALDAPNYTVFSNNTSQKAWIKDHAPTDPHFVVSLESPHDAIHLAVGGFYQAGVYNADNIQGANGDMGDNETAGFDPIFWLHHCFIDYAFWVWQKRNNHTSSLEVIPNYAGTVSDVGLPDIPPNTTLDMQTPLYPFKKPDGTVYLSEDVVDIQKLGYSFGKGSLDSYMTRGAHFGAPANTAPITLLKRVHNIDRAQYAGSFVIRLHATGPDGNEVEVGREPILSRWSVQGCANCQSNLKAESLVPLHEPTLRQLRGTGTNEDIQYRVEIQTRQGGGLRGAPLEGGSPQIDDLV